MTAQSQAVAPGAAVNISRRPLLGVGTMTRKETV